MPKSFPSYPEKLTDAWSFLRKREATPPFRLRLEPLLLGLCLTLAIPARADDPSVWHSTLTYAGRSAKAERTADGFRLESGETKAELGAQPAGLQTASALFDAGFALAQSELAKARTTQISFNGFDDGKPTPCECLAAGGVWPWVWTRDTAYATDLSLFRFDPQRARNSLEFKLSGVRASAAKDAAPAGALYVVQDIGSGGSWPVSTDRIVWFLGARHLLGGSARPSTASGSPGLLPDAAFDAKVYKALTATLAQDRHFAFDSARGLYRGETSFLDYREQSYPSWTKSSAGPIAASFALSTNVLFYEALQFAATLAEQHHEDPAAYRQQAAALKAAIDREFWREDRGLYMSYAGLPGAPLEIDAYDLLGTSLAIISGVAPSARGRRALANYPTRDAGSPVVWPERQTLAAFHNKSAWPFVSAYALKAARALDEPSRIAHELRSILRNAVLAGSNMENYELSEGGSVRPEAGAAPAASAPASAGVPQGAVHDSPQVPVDILAAARRGSAAPPSRSDGNGASGAEAANGKRQTKHDSKMPWKTDSNQPGRRGPSGMRRELMSIAGYLDAVVEGVFGLTERGKIEPKLPRELLPMLFGDGSEITLALPDRRITLVLPKQLDASDNLLVAASMSGTRDTRVQLRGVHVADSPLPLSKPFYAPDPAARPTVERDGAQWRVRDISSGKLQLYVDGKARGEFTGETTLPAADQQQCISVTIRGAAGIESSPTEPVCVGDTAGVGGDWPRSWTAERDGRYQARIEYLNRYGPIFTGITAVVKHLDVRCASAQPQGGIVVMPQTGNAPLTVRPPELPQLSTAASFNARAGQRCTFALDGGFNMSFLDKYVTYTGGAGGRDGPINDATYLDLKIVKVDGHP